MRGRGYRENAETLDVQAELSMLMHVSLLMRREEGVCSRLKAIICIYSPVHK